MSARNFYQTLYQGDSIFRLATDTWDVQEAPEPATALASIADKAMDLLTELDALAAGPVSVSVVTPVLDDTAVDVVAASVAQPEPTPAIIPDPLPQPPPRPTVPSVLPPVQQQPRLPQLNHKVLLLADEDLDPSNLLFLEKILKAVNLNVDGVDLLNLNGVQDVNFAELLRGKYVNHFITFGVPFERINLDIMMDRYSPVRFEGITFLMADSLPTIEADQNLKKRLWGALQRVFLR